jgi:hypothetical protein
MGHTDLENAQRVTLRKTNVLLKCRNCDGSFLSTPVNGVLPGFTFQARTITSLHHNGS